MLVRECDKLVKLWDSRKNGSIPDGLTVHSRDVYDWVCRRGHSFPSTVSARFRSKQWCPVCANKMVLAGVNDLGTLFPELEPLWGKQNDSAVSEVNPRSAKGAWWDLPCGHTVFVEIRGFVSGSRQCNYCSGQQVLTGFNDLATVNPVLAGEFDESRNRVSASEIHNGARGTVWWKCSAGHSWEASVHSRKVRGSACPYCSGRQAIKGETGFAVTHPELLNELHPTKNGGVDLGKVKQGSHTRLWWQCDKGHEWEAFVYNRSAGKGCPECSVSVSAAEREIGEWVASLGFSPILNDRKMIAPYELDVLVLERRVGIEYNGLYWHTEQGGKTSTYHYDKWKACQAQGIQLIQIWEDDYLRNPEQVKRMLAHKLGVSEERKVFARNTCVIDLDSREAVTFMKHNHVQGYVSGSIRIGLREVGTGELVAAMVLHNEPGTNGTVLNLARYATSARVVGGFTKLLKHVERTHQPKKVITFSDHCVSDGGLYESNGFVADKELKPDYTYVVGGERKHKFGYRLKRFREDPDLQYRDGLTESELATLNHLPRIWDAGKTRWVYTPQRK